ncbi:hypothetical protein D7X33_09890 [Butyricicoccus sp. 1XD8-22]|nr:hypothetical protein D7X33_09890 [Butyricicoccus sp. 1XD8-22]
MAYGLHPLGLFAPDPEMLTHLFLACGRDGGFGCSSIGDMRSDPARHKDSGPGRANAPAAALPSPHPARQAAFWKI